LYGGGAWYGAPVDVETLRLKHAALAPLFKGTLGEKLLKREFFYSLEEAKVLIEQWRWRR